MSVCLSPGKLALAVFCGAVKLPVAANFSGGNLLANISVRNLGNANNGLPEDVLLCHFEVLPGGTVPDYPIGTANGTAYYFALWNGLVPDVPDSAHSAGIALVRTLLPVQ